MPCPTLAATARTLHQPMRTIWIALALTAPFYIFLAWAIETHGLATWVVPAPATLLLVGGTALAGICAVVSLRADRWLFFDRVPALLARELDINELARDAYRRVNLRTLRQLQQMSDEKLRLFALRGPYFSATMARLACAEGIAVIGFALALVAGNYLLSAPFAGIAVLLMIPAWPDFEATLAQLQTEQKSQLPMRQAS